jgi:hypothetical protein
VRLLIDYTKITSPKSVSARLQAAHGAAMSIAISLVLLNAIKVLAFLVAITLPLLLLMKIYQVSLIIPPPPVMFSQFLYTIFGSSLHNCFINSFFPPLDLLLDNELAPPHFNSLLVVTPLD